ncbi:hypothetical protein NEMBOFW57_010804 [Staphylotrichum longicolle]|uniref:Uncharacterized protein n=1 Tax=Staphylotrichum longicolle TaxID=669026 RepID=A0AAD4HV34_9PEZI|nr:hypothetical protein NEMBOFW57_010804 [Staphylotrichum longicolle]
MAVFDDAITKVMPPCRKQTPWARSNFREITHPDPNEAKLIRELSKVEKNLVARFNKVATKTKTWKYLFDHFATIKENKGIPDVLGDRRHTSMNLLPINTDACGTVEFRRPPGVDNAQDAKKWTAFALAFVSAALTQAWTAAAGEWSSKNAHASVAQLHAFLQQGLTHLAHATRLEGWKQMIVPKSFMEISKPPFRPSDYGSGVIQAKLKKAAKESLFEVKSNSAKGNRLNLSNWPDGNSHKQIN